MTTLRTLLEEIRNEAARLPAARLVMPGEQTIYSRAQAALDILDEGGDGFKIVEEIVEFKRTRSGSRDAIT